MRTVNIPNELQQKFERSDKIHIEKYWDQYGYSIYLRSGKYRLYYRGSLQAITHTLEAAKDIAAILLHDRTEHILNQTKNKQ